MPSLIRWRRLVVSTIAHGVWRWFKDAGTINADTAVGRRFAAFGFGSMIAFPCGSVYGEPWIEIGSGTMVAELASICAGIMPGHDLGPEPVLKIGDRCVIGRGSHIVAHSSIEIGDDVYTGPYVYITDQNHSYTDPELPIGRQWPVNAAVTIGAGTWLGTGVVVLPGSVIGRNVVVAAGSVVRGEIPDRCVVAGVPARVIKSFAPESGWTRPAPHVPTATVQPPPEPPAPEQPPAPETGKPEAGVPEAGAAEAPAPEAGAAEAPAPESGAAEAGAPQHAEPDGRIFVEPVLDALVSGGATLDGAVLEDSTFGGLVTDGGARPRTARGRSTALIRATRAHPGPFVQQHGPTYCHQDSSR